MSSVHSRGEQSLGWAVCHVHYMHKRPPYIDILYTACDIPATTQQRIACFTHAPFRVACDRVISEMLPHFDQASRSKRVANCVTWCLDHSVLLYCAWH
jgi:hypothetical protein